MKIQTLFLAATFGIIAISCADKENKIDANSFSNNSLTLDTSQYTIILKDTLLKLNTEEVQSIYTIVRQFVDSFNKVHVAFQIDIGRYKFQFVPLKNKTGQKLFWINSFCDGGNTRWKNEIYIVKDGGKCFFNLKINLTTESYFDLIVNDFA